MTGLLAAFLAGAVLAKMSQRPHRPQQARRALRVAGWEAFKASVADSLLLFDLKGVYSQSAGPSNPAPTGDSPHQIR